jgi:PTS system N-acetylgalactosamine-specific IIA component
MSDVRAAVVAGHGSFAAGMCSAVAQIVGPAHGLVAVSNAVATPEEIRTALEAALEASGARVLFTDLPAGSCTMAARRIARARPGLVVVTGVSLPVLLAYVTGSDVAAAVRAGHGAVAVVEGGA